MQKILSIILISFLLVSESVSQTPTEKGLEAITRNSLEAQLQFLASDWFEGREATTKGAFMAADYLASLYADAGVETFLEDSYLQDVPLLVAHQPHKATITINTNKGERTFDFPTHLRAERVKESFNIEAGLVWGGFGINQDQLKEINGKNAKGKILIRLAGLPTGNNDSELSKLLETKSQREWNTIKHKVLKESGVVAVLEYDITNPDRRESINNQHSIENASEQEMTIRSSGIYNKSFFLPDDKKQDPYFYKVSKTLMNELIPDFDVFLKQYISNLQNLHVPKTVKLNSKSALLSTTANVENKSCQNVIAMIEGSEYPNEIIVVGAHYDHLGAYDGYIWNGADDNGTGAIGTIAIARAFMATGIQPKRTIVFANWTAEERGLLGSRYFVNEFDEIDKVKYYHNYDMIGRSKNFEQPDSAVTFIYTAAWKEAEELCRNSNEALNLGLKIQYSAWDKPTSGSDNAPFARKGIPIMWFHTGGHESYHMPSDHTERIDWYKFESVVKTSFLTLWNLANE